MAAQDVRITSRDIARRAGVSVNTVSLVVRESPLVAPGTRDKVKAVIAELGYRPHAAAAALRLTRSHTLAFLVSWGQDFQLNPDLPADIYPTIDVFRNQLLSAITSKARQAGYYLLLDTFADLHRCLALVNSARIDGAVLDMLVDDTLLDHLIARRVPLVLAGRDAGNRDVCWVKADEEGGAYSAIQYLLSLGHSRFGVISADREVSHAVVRARLDGYRRALREAGLNPEAAPVAQGDWSFDSGYRHCQELMAVPSRPTALFALSEIMAAGALQGALELGLQVPGDLSIVCTEDSPMVDYVRPRLSAVHVPMFEVGTKATEVLVSLLDGSVDGPKQVVLPAPFVVRDSCGVPRPSTLP